MPEADAIRAIHALAAAAPRILFSLPQQISEPTHINVRPPAYWLALWATAGFAPSVTHDASYLAPHAYVLERSENGRSERDLIAFSDRIRHRVALSQVGAALHATKACLANVKLENIALQSKIVSLTRNKERERRSFALKLKPGGVRSQYPFRTPSTVRLSRGYESVITK